MKQGLRWWQWLSAAAVFGALALATMGLVAEVVAQVAPVEVSVSQPMNVAQWGGTAVPGGSGTATAASPRVVLATDVALPAGTNNLGNVDIERAAAAATVQSDDEGFTTDTELLAATANARLLGWTVRESAGTAAPATVVLRHGVISAGACTATDNAVAYIELAANESAQQWFGERGIATASGICADVLGGMLDINIFTVIEASP